MTTGMEVERHEIERQKAIALKQIAKILTEELPKISDKLGEIREDINFMTRAEVFNK